MKTHYAKPAKTLLDGLGKDANAIAQKLENVGVTGERCSLGFCPLANYLRRCFPQAHYVAVAANGIRLDHEEIVPSPCLREFIVEFDRGRFPLLVTEAPVRESKQLAIRS